MIITAKVPYIEGKVLSLDGDIDSSLHSSVAHIYNAKIGETVSVPFNKCYFDAGIEGSINTNECDEYGESYMTIVDFSLIYKDEIVSSEIEY